MPAEARTPPRRVLFVGFNAASIAFDSVSPRISGRIQTGIDSSVGQLTQFGFVVELCPLEEGIAGAEALVRARLLETKPDCVVVGAGLRLIPRHSALFQAVVNAANELAPNAKLAFNTTPADAAETVLRLFPR